MTDRDADAHDGHNGRRRVEPRLGWLVAYDISNDAQRKKVAARIAAYGSRVQYSVFNIDGTLDDARSLCRRTAALIDAGDSVLLVPWCANCDRHDRGDPLVARTRWTVI